MRHAETKLDVGFREASKRFEYFALMAPAVDAVGAETSISVVHENGLAIFTWRGKKTARIEMGIAKYGRMALLTNLVAIATDDVRGFYKGQLAHRTASVVQAVERIVLWGIFMPGEYELELLQFDLTNDGRFSSSIEARSHFGRGGLKKIEGESPAHRFVLAIAKRLAGVDNLGKVDRPTRYIHAAAWLGISAILAAPDGGRPSDGLGILTREGVVPLFRFKIRPFFDKLDRFIGPIVANDKKYVIMRLVDYDGHIAYKRLTISAKTIKGAVFKVGDSSIRMVDVLEVAAKSISRRGGWSGALLILGHVDEMSDLDSIPSLKYFA